MFITIWSCYREKKGFTNYTIISWPFIIRSHFRSHFDYTRGIFKDDTLLLSPFSSLSYPWSPKRNYIRNLYFRYVSNRVEWPYKKDVYINSLSNLYLNPLKIKTEIPVFVLLREWYPCGSLHPLYCCRKIYVSIRTFFYSLSKVNDIILLCNKISWEELIV